MTVQTEAIAYEGPGGSFEGTVSWDASIVGPRPGVLVAHAYSGQGEFDTAKAELLAELGYVGFAIDMYGQGVRANNPEEAGELMAVLVADRELLSQRINRALEVLKGHELVDSAKTGAIGFCFGGRCVIDLARSEAEVLGVASFHGIYDAPGAGPAGDIPASLLILHGWEDPLALPEAVVELGNELTRRNADWQIHAFGNTNHAFTNPNAGGDGMNYNPLTTSRAWRTMEDFFSDLFS